MTLLAETVTDSLGLKRSEWAWSERWRRSSFLQAYGDHTFEASYAATMTLLRLSSLRVFDAADVFWIAFFDAAEIIWLAFL